LTRLKIGVVGAGRWGRNLIRCISALSDAEVAAVCDVAGPPDPVPGAAVFHRDFDGLLASGLPAIVIATPAELHASQAVAALDAGIHVFVEKPMALTLRDASRMRDAATASGRTLMVGHLLRYHPASLELEGLIRRDDIGVIQRAVAVRFGAGAPPRTMGTTGGMDGPWWSLAPHDLSLLRHLLGAEIVEVSVRRATGGSGLGAVRARIRTTAAPADIIVSDAHDAKVRRVVIVGSEGSAVFEDAAYGAELVLLRGLRASRDPAAGVEQVLATVTTPLHRFGSTAERIPFPRIEPLLSEAAHFVSAIRSGGPVMTDAEEGCRVTAALEAGALSLSRDGRWTPVPSPGQAETERRIRHSEQEELR
jgi:UDP-2-acetamido-3-amino-2,3-dideoxy-glucuronate N-acetyltransferase